MDGEGGRTAQVRRLSQGTVRQILASQTVPSFDALAKELIENALDSGSRTIRVNFCNHGSDYFEVTDEGGGISRDCLDLLCNFGGTSKIREYSDLEEGLEGFGFRGEGLAAIKIIADIEVTSRVRGQEKGYKALYKADEDVPLILEAKCPEGTTVRVLKPFSRDKIKREEFLKHDKAQYKQVIENLQLYAIIFSDKHFEANHYLNGRNNLIFSYPPNNTTLERLGAIYSPTLSAQLKRFEESFESPSMKVIIHQTLHQLSGSAHRSLVTSSELFFIVNDHPITPPRTLKLPIDRVYQEYNSQAKYFVLIQVSTDKAGMDFNLSKDKREVVGAKGLLPTMMANIVTMISKNLKDGPQQTIKIFDAKDKLSLQLPSMAASADDSAPGSQSSSVDKSPLRSSVSTPTGMRTPTAKQVTTLLEQWSIQSVAGSDRKADSFSSAFSRSSAKNARGASPITFVKPERRRFPAISEKVCDDEHDIENDNDKENIYLEEDDRLRRSIEPEARGTKMDEEAENREKFSSQEDTPWQTNHKTQTLLDFTKNAIEPENIYKDNDFEKPSRRVLANPPPLPYFAKKDQNQKSASNNLMETLWQRLSTTAGDDQSTSIRFKTADFKSLSVVGQFNKGFIICHRVPFDSRYFVIDQHAADEKRNYERLKKEMKIGTQVLLMPIVVELNITEGLTLQQHLKTFQDNGFQLTIREDLVRNRIVVHITGVPNVCYWKYDEKDFHDLLYLLVNHCGPLEELLVPKTKREFATKACRSSIKIGDALDSSSMKNIVTNMSSLIHPWNCPHGRPSTIIASTRQFEPINRKALKERLKTTF